MFDTDNDIARLAASEQRIRNELDRVQSLLQYSAPSEPFHARLRYVIGEAQGDLDGALARGHRDVTSEHALLAAVHLFALLEHERGLAACSCPLQPGVSWEQRLVSPDCRVCGEDR